MKRDVKTCCNPWISGHVFTHHSPSQKKGPENAALPRIGLIHKQVLFPWTVLLSLVPPLTQVHVVPQSPGLHVDWPRRKVTNVAGLQLPHRHLFSATHWTPKTHETWRFWTPKYMGYNPLKMRETWVLMAIPILQNQFSKITLINLKSFPVLMKYRIIKLPAPGNSALVTLLLWWVSSRDLKSMAVNVTANVWGSKDHGLNQLAAMISLEQLVCGLDGWNRFFPHHTWFLPVKIRIFLSQIHCST